MFDDMNLSTMLATGAIFLAMIVILNAMFYKPLLNFMDERDNSIKNDETKVKDNSQEILEVNDELEKIQKATREEILKIKQSATEQAKQEVEKEFRIKKEELEKKTASFYAYLQAQKQELKKDLMVYLPELKQALQNNLRRG